LIAPGYRSSLKKHTDILRIQHGLVENNRAPGDFEAAVHAP
jgi:hypothetical protein